VASESSVIPTFLRAPKADHSIEHVLSVMLLPAAMADATLFRFSLLYALY
jgi:hypothetical protein